MCDTLRVALSVALGRGLVAHDVLKCRAPSCMLFVVAELGAERVLYQCGPACTIARTRI